MTMEDKPVVLVVDDEQDAREILYLWLVVHGFQVLTAATFNQALMHIYRNRGKNIVALIDLDLKGGNDGFDLLRYIDTYVAERVVSHIITGYSQDATKIRAMIAGAHHVFVKTKFKNEDLLPLLNLEVVKAQCMRQSGSKDKLTGLFNLEGFKTVVDAVMQPTRAALETQFSLLLVDVNHFKEFNDTYEYATGDAVLVAIAGIMRQHFQRPSDRLGRVGGDEFLVFLQDVDEQSAIELGRRLSDDVQKLTLPKWGIGAGAVSVSFGVACAKSTDSNLSVTNLRSRAQLDPRHGLKDRRSAERGSVHAR